MTDCYFDETFANLICDKLNAPRDFRECFVQIMQTEKTVSEVFKVIKTKFRASKKLTLEEFVEMDNYSQSGHTRISVLYKTSFTDIKFIVYLSETLNMSHLDLLKYNKKINNVTKYMQKTLPMDDKKQFLICAQKFLLFIAGLYTYILKLAIDRSNINIVNYAKYYVSDNYVYKYYNKLNFINFNTLSFNYFDQIFDNITKKHDNIMLSESNFESTLQSNYYHDDLIYFFPIYERDLEKILNKKKITISDCVENKNNVINYFKYKYFKICEFAINHYDELISYKTNNTNNRVFEDNPYVVGKSSLEDNPYVVGKSSLEDNPDFLLLCVLNRKKNYINKTLESIFLFPEIFEFITGINVMDDGANNVIDYNIEFDIKKLETLNIDDGTSDSARSSDEEDCDIEHDGRSSDDDGGSLLEDKPNGGSLLEDKPNGGSLLED
jgi:hypothetical protein